MFKRVFVLASAAIAASPAAAQPAPPASATQASAPVPREQLERYVGSYALNGTIATVTLTDDGRLHVQLAGQPTGPPLRTVSANEFVSDALGVRVSFEGEGPKATRIRSRFNGGEMVGARVADSLAAAPAVPRAMQAGPTLDAAQRQDAVRALGSALRQRYVFPDIGEQAAARLDSALAAGEYDGLSDPAAFAARLNADVGAVARDKHLGISSINGPPPAPPPGAMARPGSEAGIVRADKLAGGIGYIEVVAFPRPVGFKPVIDPVMTRLADITALIIDLRRNGGGLPEGVNYLISFLLPPGAPVHINDIVGRVAGTNAFTRDSYFSQPTPVSFADRPVYILTSSRTFSGGEAFAYDARSLGRGVLVGELTGGGGNISSPAQLGHGLIASIPVARGENAVTKGNWEGRGVEPDVVVPAADALAVALQRLGQPGLSDIAAASRQQVFAPRTVQLPGSEAALRAILAGVMKDPPDLTAMGPEQALMLREQLPLLQGQLRPLGELKSVRFVGPGLPAGDAFDVTFAKGALGMTVMLGPDGLLIGWQFGPSSPSG